MEFNYDLTRLPGSHREPSAFLEEGSYFGPYRIVGLLGRGGMGEVYEAEHRDLHTRHALKLINPEIVDRPDAKERFKREARVMARLRHPNIVHVDDFGELDGRIWLRMDLMNGWAYGGKTYQSLQELMRDEGALSESLVRRLLGEILDGLGFAHDAGAVHRDLKPANLLLNEQGNVKITDFGLVSLAGAEWLQNQVQLTVARSMADPDATRLDMQSGSAGTSTQALLGTYAYMSPEQKKGSEVDARSDLYAAGLIGFQMLTGEETPGFEMPSDLVDNIDPSWDQWVRQSLASRADRRFSEAKEMSREMPIGRGVPSEVTPPQLDQEFSRLEQRIEELDTPPPLPEFESTAQGDHWSEVAEPLSANEAFTESEELVSSLSDQELKKAYFASRNIKSFSIIVGIISACLLLGGLILLADGDPDAPLILVMGAIGVPYVYWSIKRAEWHRIALIVTNILSLVFSFNILSGLLIFVLSRNVNLFGSNRLEHKKLKEEFKKRA